MKFSSLFSRWQANFLTGLAIVLPAAVSIGLLVWMFGTVANLTDALLFFLPERWTHSNQGLGPTHWYWRLVSLLVGLILTGLVGQLARFYFGLQIIQVAESFLLRVPLLNKIYSTIKQVNEAFTSSNKSAFKQVVLVEFPQAGQYAVGFVTGEQHDILKNVDGNLVSVFVPTTPNPTSGFMLLVSQKSVTKLDLSVAEGIKFIISLGALSPETPPGRIPGPARPPSYPG
jgi:uncharacterized membrane protein